MKMVAAAKLHRAQRDIGALVPYSEELQGMVAHLATGEGVGRIPLAEVREDVGRVRIVGFASNSTLCGAYNGNVAREVVGLAREYAHLGTEGVEILALGHRLSVELAREGYAAAEGAKELAERPDYARIKDLAEGLMEAFLKGECDRVELVYYKFYSAGNQRLVREQLLPVELPEGGESEQTVSYILEPSRAQLVEQIVPRQVALKLYTAALSAVVSEHAARMMAMQVATDNADELIKELSVEYNKQRQQAITTELLDIMGGQQG